MDERVRIRSSVGEILREEFLAELGWDEAELARAADAVQCYATQFDAASRAQLVNVFDQSIWQGAVHFRRAFGRKD